MRNRLLIIIVAASIASIVAGVYFLTPVGAIQVRSGSSSVVWSIERATTISDKIVVAKLVSVANIVVNEPFTYIDRDTGEQKSDPRTTPYHEVTLQVERYLKDTVGDGSTQLVYRDPMVKGIFFINGVKYNFETEDAAQYKIGERAIFFLKLAPDKSQIIATGETAKLTIDETSGTAQSEFLAREGKPPMKMEELESKITGVLTKINAASSEPR